MQYLKKALGEFHQIWHKHPLGLNFMSSVSSLAAVCEVLSRRSSDPQKCQGKTKTTISEKKEKKIICKPGHKGIPKKTGEASNRSHTVKNKEQDKGPPNASGENTQSGKGSDFKKKDKPRSHPSSEKSTKPHPRPHKNK